MHLVHVDLIDQDFHLRKNQTMVIEYGRIAAIAEHTPVTTSTDEIYDLSGLILIPGMIDMHIHGAVGCDTSDGSGSALGTISSFLITKGVTGFCPTTMMISDDQVRQVFQAVVNTDREEQVGARMLGVRMEGPFLSKEKCGVQNTAYAQDPTLIKFQQLLEDYPEDIVRVIDIAPELPGAMEFIDVLKNRYVFSIAHTAASFECCREALARGVKHGTHLFNAMNPLHHHEPGAVGALLDASDTTCELICDGMHVHPAVIRFAWKILGADRVVVVSDAMRAAGMPDGVYDLGGTPVTVREGRTDFGNGRLAGSTTNLHDEFLYLLSIGIPFEEALKACTINPARVLRMNDEIGSLAVGKFADMVAMDQQHHIRKVWVHGKLVLDN